MPGVLIPCPGPGDSLWVRLHDQVGRTVCTHPLLPLAAVHARLGCQCMPAHDVACATPAFRIKCLCGAYCMRTWSMTQNMVCVGVRARVCHTPLGTHQA